MAHIHTNKLINESSPYLLQHAHNPVDWYPWGNESLQKAKAEDKPILVSIGYSACHWCHVMERESFEDEATAALMNEYFVNIKIDREERPDLDHIYMDAVQAISGSGGWPLNVFLTPDKKPFYGGTYFPPVQAFNKISWKELLTNIHKMFSEKRHEVESQADNLTNHLMDSNSFGLSIPKEGEDTLFSMKNMELIADNIMKQADTEDGGFGRAPKFPQTFVIQYLLRQYHFAKDERCLKQALLSLDKMIYGGIYDQLGGGFARYSTDNEWLAPHFEKMLYDNALLVNVLAEAYQLTDNPLYAETIAETLEFIKREMTSPENGFYSAIDADSEGVEGKFYVWSKQEVDNILGEDSDLFCKVYDVSEKGNWEHTNILRIKTPVEQFAVDNNININDLKAFLKKAKQKLLTERGKRARPELDDKMLLGWNTLMITAYCKAYAATSNPAYKEAAEKAIRFIEKNFMGEDGACFHTYKEGKAKIEAFLDDYAFLIQAYIHLQEISANNEYLDKAKGLTEFVISNFQDDETGYFFYTKKNQGDIIVRKKEIYDGATPSGNSIMLHNLIYLSHIFEIRTWEQNGLALLDSLRYAMIKYPSSFGIWASLVQIVAVGIQEHVLIGREILKELPQMLKKYMPNKIIQSSVLEFEKYPLLAGRFIEGRGLHYICENGSCKPPISLLPYN